MKHSNDEVALSETIGFVLLLALIVSALTLYMAYIVPVTGREAEISQMDRISEQFTDYKFTLDNIRTSVQVNNLSPVMTSTSFNLGTGGGSTQASGFFLSMLQPVSSTGTLVINTTGDTFDIDSSSYHSYRTALVDFPINITSLEYRSSNKYWIQQRYSYQLGGVFLSQDDGATNRISPLFSISRSANNSVVVNIVPVQLVGGGSLSGNGPAQVNTRQRILPKYNISTDPYLANTWVNLSFTSADNQTAAMWLNIFKDTVTREQLSASAYITPDSPVWNPGSKTATVFINITGTNPDPTWKDVSLYVKRADFYVSLNNFVPESVIPPIPTTTTTIIPTTTTPTPPSPPTFTSIAPTSGSTAGGTLVTITGTGFTGATAVTFGGTAATSFTVDSATQITATTPAHSAGAVDVVITAPGGTATGTNAFTFVTPPPAPTVTGISPSIGTILGGTSVTVTGTDFTGATAVTFGAIAAPSFTVDSATQITATSPAGSSAGPVNVTVTTPGGTSATSPSDIFRYYVIQSFTSSTTWSVPSGVNTVEYLVVAGGGGGVYYGGGGGAGGFRVGTLTGLSGSQTVTVGTGGAGATSTAAGGTNGGNSAFGTNTSTGGGGGGTSSGTLSIRTGKNGGSGGGGIRSSTLGGTGISGEGKDGGAGYTNTDYWGGGGGASAVGANAANALAGDGGAGTASSITDVLVTYAGGGGGGCRTGTAGVGGTGGGGAGGTNNVVGSDATGYGSGGGGGGRNRAGGAGSSGIVIIKYY